MWCYQKPGFAALLLAELQRQQQCSQFCDTLLKTEGVSVPAHSCILSAISPQFSSSLSSTPPPPAGERHLLEFHALGACTLLHLVRLLYSGEMAGEGEEERQEAVSAAAKLGIQGLVEVTRRDRKSRNENREGTFAEVGVQTEPVVPEENEGRRGGWRREVRDGVTFLWRETHSDGGKGTWTQTELLQDDTAPPSQPASSFETIDMGALQSLGQTDPTLAPPQIPYIPVSLVYPTDENQSQASPCVDPKSWWAGAAEEQEEEQLEQFQGNIPGYINYFLNPNTDEGPCRGRPRRRRAAGAGGARRAGTGERRPRRPRAQTGGRGRGGLTQTVDVQSVGVSKMQKLFLQRWGMRTSMTGQGGGAVGRRLHLKTRELLKPAKSCQRRRRRGKEWDLSQSGDMKEGGGSNTQQLNQDLLPIGRAQRARGKPTPSASFPSPPMRFYNVHHAISASSLASPGLMSPASSYVSPASSLLHSIALPPPAPPPNEPEHIDRLLEEVMMGLDILPHSNNGAPLSQRLPPTTSNSCNKQQGGTTQVVRGRGGGASTSAVPVLQQQGEGMLNDMLESFLQSFEQHVDSCSTREEVEMDDQSCTEAVQSKYRKTKTQTTSRHSQICELQQSEAETLQNRVSQNHTEETPDQVTAPARRRKKRGPNQYLFTHEKKRVRVRKPVLSSEAKDKADHEQENKQLRQVPVVKLERSGPLPVRVTLQGHSCPGLEEESPEKPKSRSSSVKSPHGSWTTKTYPIRSRFREAHITNSMPFLHEPLLEKRPPPPDKPRHRPGRPKKNRQLVSLSNAERSTSPIQQQPVEPYDTDEHQETHGEDINVQPQEETDAPRRRGKMRRAEEEEETSDDATVAKRLCFEKTPQPTFEAHKSSSAKSGNTETLDMKDVDASEGDCLQREKRGGMNLEDEEIDVDGDVEDDRHRSSRSPLKPSQKPDVSPLLYSEEEVSLHSTGSCNDDDVDVIGGSSPAPDPVVITWTDSSGGEEEEVDEDVDVVGEKSDFAPSALFIAMSKGEFENMRLRCS